MSYSDSSYSEAAIGSSASFYKNQANGEVFSIVLSIQVSAVIDLDIN